MSTSVFGFFGLRENPFSINPNPRFLYLTPLMQSSSHQLLEGIRDRKGLILLTGEVGTGKTLLLRRLLDWLTEQSMPTAMIFNSHVNPDHLLDFILSDFGIPCESGSKSEKLIALNNWLLERFRAGQTPVLIIDEAQGLPLHALEEVRLLLNLETPRQKLLQVVLAGQPELEEKLRLHELRQLRQRITVRCRTAPLTAPETRAYIQARLRTAGATEPIFQHQAATAVHAYSHGIPRVINLLCEHSLINACADGSHVVSPAFVERAAHDCQLDQIESVSRVLSSDYPARAANDFSSIFAGMGLPDSSPPTENYGSVAVDAAVLAKSAYSPMESDLEFARNDSSANPAAIALAGPLGPMSDPFASEGSLTHEECPTPVSAPAQQVHPSHDQRATSSSNGSQSRPPGVISPLTATRPHAGLSPATGSLFRAWWESFSADARSTGRQLYALMSGQIVKLKPHARTLTDLLVTFQGRASRLSSNPQVKAYRDGLLATIHQINAKIGAQVTMWLEQFSARTKSRPESTQPTGHPASANRGAPLPDRRSRMAKLHRWLRAPFAPHSNQRRSEDRSVYRRRWPMNQ